MKKNEKKISEAKQMIACKFLECNGSYYEDNLKNSRIIYWHYTFALGKFYIYKF